MEIFFFFLLFSFIVNARILTTLDGPTTLVTVASDNSFRGKAIDLPAIDSRVKRRVKGFEPEQISVTLFASYDSVWISCITGEFKIGDDIRPLYPDSVASVVRYGRLRYPMTHEAEGQSLVYDQLYPFEGLQNYTSGIIHHVGLTDIWNH